MPSKSPFNPFEHVLTNLQHQLHEMYGIDVSAELDAVRDKIQEAQMSADKPDLMNVDGQDLESKSDMNEENRFALIASSAFECSICQSLLVAPLTIPCGHTFCRTCIMECLDKNRKKCPNCRTICHIDPKTRPETFGLVSVLQNCFPEMYAKRLTELNEVLDKKAKCEIPIFYIPIPHVSYTIMKFRFYEPRYLTMVRRAVEGDRKFGFVCADERGVIRPDMIGLDAHIIKCDFFNDQCVVEVLFGHRFQIHNAWMEDSTMGLWIADKRDFKDEILADTVLLSDSLQQAYGYLRQFVVKCRNVSFNENHLPQVDLSQEPPNLDWILTRQLPENADLETINLALSKWTMFVAAAVRTIFPNVESSDLERIVAMRNAHERMMLLVGILSRTRAAAATVNDSNNSQQQPSSGEDNLANRVRSFGRFFQRRS